MGPQPMGKVPGLRRLAGRVASRSTVHWSSLCTFIECRLRRRGGRLHRRSAFSVHVRNRLGAIGPSFGESPGG